MAKETIPKMMMPKDFVRERTLDGFEIPVLLPEPPKDYREIENWDKPVLEQKWVGGLLKDHEFDNLSDDEQDDYLEKVIYRRIHGHWFYSKGNIEYVTGHHYLYCKIWDLGGFLPWFCDSDRDFFYAVQHGENDPACQGVSYMASRRDGKTDKGNCILYNRTTLRSFARGGIQSKTGTDGKLVFSKLVRAWKRLPNYLKPLDSGEKDPKKELSFTEPPTRSTKGGKKEYKEVLNSYIDFGSSAETHYDGSKLYTLLFDEIGKTEEVDVRTRLEICVPCIMQGRTVVGKIFAITTAEKMEKGGREFYDIWLESNPLEKLPSGRTRSGLYRYYKPAWYGLENYIDEYGYTVKDDPIKPVKSVEKGKWITEGSYSAKLRDREGLDGERLRSEKRKYSFTWQEAFILENKDSTLAIDKINEQIEYNSTIKRGVNKGNFVPGRSEGEVEFVADSNGRWEISWFPPPEQRCQRIVKNGRPRGAHYMDLILGIDPFDNKITNEGRKSDGSGHIYRRFNSMDPVWSDIVVASYIARPPLPEIFYEDMRMAAVFYGADVLCENNKIGIINWFRLKGFYEYLMDRPESTYTQKQRRQQEKGVPMSGDQARNELVDCLVVFSYKNLGIRDPETLPYKNNGEITYGNFPFDRTLRQMADFDMDKWTVSDACVSLGLALLGAKNRIRVVKPPEPHKPPFKVYSLKKQ